MNKADTIAIHDTGSRQRRLIPRTLATRNTLVSRRGQGSPGLKVCGLPPRNGKVGDKNDGFGPSGSESKINDHAKENKHMSHPTIPPLCRKVNSSYCRHSDDSKYGNKRLRSTVDLSLYPQPLPCWFYSHHRNTGP